MTRDIIQKPSYGGKQCEGPLTKTVNCKLTPCPGTLLVEYMDSNSSNFPSQAQLDCQSILTKF